MPYVSDKIIGEDGYYMLTVAWNLAQGHGISYNFGEQTTDYVIVNTKQNEFDYPKGDLNVYTHYEGQGGIVLDSFFN